MGMFKICQILVISAVIAMTESTCDGKYKLHTGDVVTIADASQGGKCTNKFRCADGRYSCDIVIKCPVFSFPSGSWLCRKNFLRVKDDGMDYGKNCDATGAPDFVVYMAGSVKLIAAGNYNFECQVSVGAPVDTTTYDYGSDNYDYGGHNGSDHYDYGSDNGSGNYDYGGNNGSDYYDYGGDNGTDYGIGTDTPDYGTDFPVFPDTTPGGPPPPPPTTPAATDTTAAVVSTTAAGGNSSSGCCSSYTPSSDTRIVGGVAVDVGEFPWQAALRTLSGQHYCGGTVISKSWILTAKHCVEGSSAADIKIYLGDHHVDHSDGETVHLVSQIVMPPNTFAANDIALLKLKTPATFSDRVKPACLPASLASELFEGKNVWVTGWGTTSSGGSLSKTLLKVYVPVVSNTVCADKYSPQFTIGANELCAGKGGKDSCQGDSGGPAVYADGPQKRAYIVGVVSWGIGCASSSFPGVYVRVTSYLDWIKSTTNGDGVCYERYA